MSCDLIMTEPNGKVNYSDYDDHGGCGFAEVFRESNLMAPHKQVLFVPCGMSLSTIGSNLTLKTTTNDNSGKVISL